MIETNFYIRSKKWPRRKKKIEEITNKILKIRNEIKFNKNIKYYLNIILISDIEIRNLNKKYRNINRSTDVLTFVSNLNNIKEKKNKHCDIFFSAERIELDAKKNKVDFYDHFTHILVHSFLHINGYNHKKLIDFKKMQNIEKKILRSVGIKDPYIL